MSISFNFPFHLIKIEYEIDGDECEFQSTGGGIMLLLCIAAFVPAIPIPWWVGLIAIGVWILFNTTLFVIMHILFKRLNHFVLNPEPISTPKYFRLPFHLIKFGYKIGDINGNESEFKSRGGIISTLVCIAAFLPFVPIPWWSSLIAVGTWILFNGMRLAVYVIRPNYLDRKDRKSLYKTNKKTRRIPLKNMSEEQQDAIYKMRLEKYLNEIVKTKQLYVGTIDDHPVVIPFADMRGNISIPVISDYAELFNTMRAQSFEDCQMNLVSGDINYILNIFKDDYTELFFMFKNIEPDTGIIINMNQIIKYISSDSAQFDVFEINKKSISLEKQCYLDGKSIQQIENKEKEEQHQESILDDSEYEQLSDFEIALREITNDQNTMFLGMTYEYVAGSDYENDISIEKHILSKDLENGISIPIIGTTKKTFDNLGFDYYYKKDFKLFGGNIMQILGRFKETPSKIYYISRDNIATIVDTDQIINYINTNMQIDAESRIEESRQKYEHENIYVLFENMFGYAKYESGMLYVGVLNNKKISYTLSKNGKTIDVPVVSMTKETFDIISDKYFNNQPIDIISGKIDFILRVFEKEHPAGFFFISDSRTPEVGVPISMHSIIEYKQERTVKTQSTFTNKLLIPSKN